MLQTKYTASFFLMEAGSCCTEQAESERWEQSKYQFSTWNGLDRWSIVSLVSYSYGWKTDFYCTTLNHIFVLFRVEMEGIGSCMKKRNPIHLMFTFSVKKTKQQTNKPPPKQSVPIKFSFYIFFSKFISGPHRCLLVVSCDSRWIPPTQPDSLLTPLQFW